MAEGGKIYLPMHHMSNSEPMDKIEAEGEGTDDEKKMHRDGTEAEKSLGEISKGAQLEDTIHNQITLEHVDPDATATARAPQDESPQDAPPLSPQVSFALSLGCIYIVVEVTLNMAK